MTTSQPDSYVAVFIDGEDQYIYIQSLGQGFQGQAQLVLHVQSGQYRVRKVDFHEQAFGDIQHSLTHHEGEILEALQQPERQAFEQWFNTVFCLVAQSQYLEKFEARRTGQEWHGILFPPPRPEDPSYQPLSEYTDQTAYRRYRQFLNWEIMPRVYQSLPRGEQQVLTNVVTLLGRSRIPCPPIPFPDNPEASLDQLYTTVLYLPYYNGGDLRRYGRAGVGLSANVHLRMVAQIGHAISAILQRGIEHSDLSQRTENIFVHIPDESKLPDFYLGDFGSARSVRPDAHWLYDVDLKFLRLELLALRRYGFRDNPNVSIDSAWEEVERLDQNRDGLTGAPDLRQLLHLIDQAVAENPVTDEDLITASGPIEIQPAHFDSPAECVEIRALIR